MYYDVVSTTPEIGKPRSEPHYTKSLKVYASPLRFLDYLLEDTRQVTLLFRGGVTVTVPAPARFALHKLVVGVRRSERTKSVKDIAQAAAVIDCLLDYPGQLHQAFEAAQSMPKKFIQQMRQGAKKLPTEIYNDLSGLLEIS